jgi:hypothetical protein
MVGCACSPAAASAARLSRQAGVVSSSDPRRTISEAFPFAIFDLPSGRHF